jgi:hypothetical protein
MDERKIAAAKRRRDIVMAKLRSESKPHGVAQFAVPRKAQAMRTAVA